MAKFGVDTGGTFTDIVLFEDNQIKVHKLMSTPDDPSRAIISGIKFFTEDLSIIETLVHGTTVATNALLERKGARTALITTKGFEDVIEIGRQNRGSLYDLTWEKPSPLVEPSLRLGITERMDYSGNELQDLEFDAESISEYIRSSGAGAIAISLINSYANHRHEEEIESALMKFLDIPVSRSSVIIPEYREYERTSTTVVNAYLVPVVRSYMRSLRKELEMNDVYIMQSNGGVISPDQASDEPVKILTSGPAGGVVGAHTIAKQIPVNNIITYDMGGTSTDISLVEGEPGFSTETVIDGFPVKVPMINVTTIGAGGGSIARLDSGGVLKVGPESAGADPGPACYGRGMIPTVTDANVVLGRIDPEWFLGGKMHIDPDRSLTAISSLIADGSDMTVEGTAEAIVHVANSNMEKALRVISIGKGYDPRDFYLFSFGGAGGLHACDLSLSLGIKGVIFPLNPGVLSALGMLMADFFKDYSMSCLSVSGEEGFKKANDIFNDLIDRSNSEFDMKNTEHQKYIDIRYKGQSYELTVPFTNESIDAFHEMHVKRYGYKREQSPVEFVNARLRTIVRKDKIQLPEIGTNEHEIGFYTKKVMYRGEYVDASVYRREEFYPGFSFKGPAIVLEDTATLFIPENFKSDVDRFGNIISVSVK